MQGLSYGALGLHERNPVDRFTSRAEDYARYRPGYPSAAFDAMLEGIDARVAADVGAGTGISARALAGRGLEVFALEPNAAMRAIGERAGGGVAWCDGSGEATGLPDASIDLALCAQSWHWLHPEDAPRELRRILRDGGRLALMWNTADMSHPLSGAYARILEEVRDGCRLAGEDPGDVPHFAKPRRLEFRNEHPVVLDTFLGRALSSSYFPKEGAIHDKLVRLLREAYEGSHEKVLVYRTELWLAEPA